MREQLNENPIAQVGLVALLVAVAAFMFISQSGGSEEESASTEAAPAVTGEAPAEPAPVEGAVEGGLETAAPSAGAAFASIPTPPLPRPVSSAYKSGDTVVLLIVHDGSIDDKLVRRAAGALEGESKVKLFVVPAKQIARYAAATVGAEVNRVPALVVMRPKHLSHGSPEASVDYGYQTSEGILQAVRDATYHGREIQYHP